MTATNSNTNVTDNGLRDINTIADHVHSAFYAADITMRDFSFYNFKIGYDAIGFHAGNDACTGIIVTPWVMTIIRVPHTSYPPLPDGEIVTRQYPSGNYDFITSYLNGVGSVENCALFSSMLLFPSHSVACQAAQEAITALFKASARSATDQTKRMTRRTLLSWGVS